jgi:hypothetical protein
MTHNYTFTAKLRKYVTKFLLIAKRDLLLHKNPKKMRIYLISKAFHTGHGTHTSVCNLFLW